MLLTKKQRPLFFLISFIVMIFLSMSGLVVAQDDAITISVDASQELNEINPYTLALVHQPGGIPLQVTEEAEAININFLRFPHGNWGDLNDLTAFQIDFFIAEVRAWNTIPSISVRLNGGSPEQAADLVRYTNIENDYDVRYWYVGNEPNLYDDYSLDQYLINWREFALAMLEVDPTITLIGPGISQFPDTIGESDPHYNLNNEWLREFLLVNGDLVDIVGVHRYPFPTSIGYGSTSIDVMRLNVPRWSTLISNLRRTISETTDGDKQIGITEVNSHWTNTGGGLATPDSHYNAIWWSGVLTTLIHEEVDIIAYFMLASVGGNGEFGILDRYEPRPTYYTYALYSQMGMTRLQSDSSDSYIIALAGQREDGAMTLILTNLYEENRSITLDLQGFDALSVQNIQLLSPEVEAESVAADDYLSDGRLTMPAQSVMLLIFE